MFTAASLPAGLGNRVEAMRGEFGGGAIGTLEQVHLRLAAQSNPAHAELWLAINRLGHA